MDERDVPGYQGGNQGAFRQRTYHSPIHDAVILRHLPARIFVLRLRGAAAGVRDVAPRHLPGRLFGLRLYAFRILLLPFFARLLPRHPRRAPVVFVRAAHRHVVRARQVVFRQGREVQDVVVAVLGTFPSRSLVERIADEEMRTRQDQLRRGLREPRFSADGPVPL